MLALPTLLIHFPSRMKQEETAAPKCVLLVTEIVAPYLLGLFLSFFLNIEAKIEEGL